MRPPRLQVQGVHIKPEATGDATDQARAARRSAVEPVIGHLKSEHRTGRNYLWHRQGDGANAVLAAVGYNFRRLIKWLSLLLEILARLSIELTLSLKSQFFTVDRTGLSNDVGYL